MTPKGKISDDKQQVTILLEKEYLEKIDKVAKKIRISRSQLLRNIILNGCEDIGILDKTGLWSVIGFLRDVKDKITGRPSDVELGDDKESEGKE